MNKQQKDMILDICQRGNVALDGDTFTVSYNDVRINMTLSPSKNDAKMKLLTLQIYNHGKKLPQTTVSIHTSMTAYKAIGDARNMPSEYSFYCKHSLSPLKKDMIQIYNAMSEKWGAQN